MDDFIILFGNNEPCTESACLADDHPDFPDRHVFLRDILLTSDIEGAQLYSYSETEYTNCLSCGSHVHENYRKNHNAWHVFIMRILMALNETKQVKGL